MVPGANPTTGTENLWGGVLAICRICEETKLLKRVHRSDVVLCTIPGETPFAKHTLFPSSTEVYRLEQVLDYFEHLSELTLHVPEYAAAKLPELLGARHVQRLVQIERVHINVLNQNIDFLPRPDELESLRALSTQLTMTTAHKRYCTEQLSKEYRVPVHHLAVPLGIEQYRRPALVEKDDLALFSPDDPTRNGEIAQVLSRLRPEPGTIEIRGLPYREYRHLLERAKWMFTFGEGLDYYFVESVFSGGIAFALYNDRFFPREFATLDTVYPSYAALRAGLEAQLEDLSEPAAYEDCNARLLAALAGIYSMDAFRTNLERFLQGDYTWRFDPVTGVGRSGSLAG